MKYSTLKALLEKLEKSWFSELQVLLPTIPPHLRSVANGSAQFFSLENHGKSVPEDEDLPVIVAVGINYAQSNPRPGFPNLNHWLHSVPPGANWVEDPPPWAPPTSWPSTTRQILDLNLAQYHLNERAWKANGYASDTGLLAQFHGSKGSFRYILVCANISPFLTNARWLSLPSTSTQQLLNAWNPNNHLCDLVHGLEGKIGLWVVHGKDEVWPRFQPCCSGIANWLLTHNLSSLPRRYIPTFWKSPKSKVSKHPIWPCCSRIGTTGAAKVRSKPIQA